MKNKNFITSELELPQWPRCVQGPRAPGPLWTHPRAPRCSQPASPRPGRLGWSHSRLLPVPARPGGLPPVLAGLRPGDKFSPRVPWRGTLPVLWFPHRGFSITSSPVSVLMISSQRSFGGWGGCGEQRRHSELSSLTCKQMPLTTTDHCTTSMASPASGSSSRKTKRSQVRGVQSRPPRRSLSVTSQGTRGGGGVSGSGHRLPAASARVWPDHICRLLEMEAAKPTSETRSSYRAEPLGIRGVRIGGPGTDGLPCAERGPGQGMVMASRSGLTDPWRPGPRGP